MGYAACQASLSMDEGGQKMFHERAGKSRQSPCDASLRQVQKAASEELVRSPTPG